MVHIMKDKKPKKLTRNKRREIIESVVGKVPWDKFEAGIYNYCDRWCEKCQKTQKCYLFWDAQKEEVELKKQGIDPKSWDGCFKSVGNSLGQTHVLLQKIAEAEELDLTITPEFEAKCDEKDKKTDPHKDPLCRQADRLFHSIQKWLDEMPSLDIQEYQEAYDKLSWHHYLIHAKVTRAIRSKKESEWADEVFPEFDLKDSKMSAWVAYRSTKICAESLELMDRYVRDFRIAPMARACRELIAEIDKNLL